MLGNNALFPFWGYSDLKFFGRKSLYRLKYSFVQAKRRNLLWVGLRRFVNKLFCQRLRFCAKILIRRERPLRLF